MNNFPEEQPLSPDAKAFFNVSDETLGTLTKWRLQAMLGRINKVLTAKYTGKYHKRRHNRPFTQLESEQFFHQIPLPKMEKYYMLWKVCENMGCRPNEARKLKISDYDPAERLMKITSWKTGGQESYRPVNEYLVGLLDEYLRLNLPRLMQKGGWLFPSTSCKCKTPYLSGAKIRNKFAYYREKAGLPDCLVCYSFRKKFANDVYEASGKDSKLVQDSLGHRSFVTTAEFYLSSSLEDRRNAVERIGMRNFESEKKRLEKTAMPIRPQQQAAEEAKITEKVRGE